MREHQPYTETENAYILEYYSSTPTRDIAAHLGRTVNGIRHQATRLGVTKSLRRWTQEEDEFIRANVHRKLSEVSRELHRGNATVSERAKQLGLTFRKPSQWRESQGYTGRRTVIEDGVRVSEWRHKTVMEAHLGRRLEPHELVHHIDCNKRNDDSDNLHVFGSVAEHIKAHRSIEKLLPELLERGIVRFDRDEGVYKLCKTRA